MWRLYNDGGPRLHVAHLDHQFRGAQSADEARFVAATAAAWNIPATIEQHNLPVHIAATGENKQAAARAVRYAFLARVATATHAAAVAVAHQADDQAETVLLHLLRGAGAAGLRGMRAWCRGPSGNGCLPIPPTRRYWCGPSLTTNRAEIEAYCAEHSLAPRHDPTNTDPHYTRSRIRTELLPLLASYNPQIIDALNRTAQVAADDYNYIQSQLDTVWTELASVGSGAVRFVLAVWQQLSPTLQRYALRRAAALLLENELPSYEQIEAGRTAAQRGTGFQQTLGLNLLLRVEHGSLLLRRTDTPAALAVPAAVPQLEAAELPLPSSGRLPIGATWWVEVATDTPPALPASSRWSVILDKDTLDESLMLRWRRAGDCFRPVGGRGSRRLQDFFIDQKIPQTLRAAWPILATAHHIVWVAGLRPDERFVPGPTTRHTLRVTFYQHQAAQQLASQAGREGTMHNDIERILLHQDEITQRIVELGTQIARDYSAEDDLLLVGVLKGCMMFMVNLAIAIDLPLAMDFIAISSYGQSTESSGVVRLIKDLDTDITGRHVLIVEDIIDSGLTLDYLRSQLLRRNPASLRICALLNKPERRQADVQVDFIGFDIPNEFVVGYGLDYAERYRNLPYIGVLKPDVYTRIHLEIGGYVAGLMYDMKRVLLRLCNLHHLAARISFWYNEQ
ncbi:MAG: hypoxanthine phosphoribosyltransferase [Chloroflexaceae bacterium]|nr:hypoxanthine phosphoribosyltransferase [Chloroflexaceae bacterium]